MRRITWAILGLFLFSILPVNAWPQQFQTPTFKQTSSSPQKPQNASTTSSTPKISVSAKSLKFPGLNLGSTSESSVAIINNGPSDLVISSIIISGNNPSDFSQTNDCTTIPSGNSCTVTVTFAPTTGGKKSGIMSIISNDPKKPTLSVKLKGSAKSSGCTYSLTSSSQECGASGGTWSVNVLASGGCNWTAASNAGWIIITSGSSGSGNGTVNYSMGANVSTSQRTGTMTIAGLTFTVTQSGVTCTYSISSTGQNFDSTGGTGSVGVTAQSGCNWTGASSADWITITSGGTGSGNGTVNYTVGANTSAAQRTGTMSIAGQTFTVTQSGLSCTSSISSASQSFDSTGGAGSVGVATQSGCNWTAGSSADWITITLGASGTGSGTVNFTVGAYVSTEQRTGTMTIAGQTYMVTQSGAASPPLATLSEYQQALIDGYGEPDYLTIVFSSEPPMRQETWVYVFPDFQKLFLFWDGESLGSTDITIDPDAYSDPPYLDPSFFTKDTKLSDLVELLGSDYTEVDQSYFSEVIGDANLKTYHFRDEGLFVAFLDDSLVSVQTVDIAESNAPASSKIMSPLPRKLRTMVTSEAGEERKIVAPTGLIITIAAIVSLIITYLKYPKQLELSNEFWSKCRDALKNKDTNKQKDCTEASLKEMKESLEFAEFVFDSIYNMFQAENKCDNKQKSVTQSVPFLSGGNLAATAGDEFPICPAPCTYTIFPVSAQFDSGGGAGSIQVGAQVGCAQPAAASNVDWITVSLRSSSATGKIYPLLEGLWIVDYAVAANTSVSSRTGTITVAGQTFTVTQAGTASCTYTIFPVSAQFDSSGGTGSIQVGAQVGCAQPAAASNVDWITVSLRSSSATGKIYPLLEGLWIVDYAVAANTSVSSRTGTITVAGQTFTVTQAGTEACMYSISPASASFDSAGGAGSFQVTAPTGCAWTAAKNVDWITITSGGSSATGTIQPLLSIVTTVTYTVAANTSTSSRTGTITVAGQTFTVTQAGTLPCTSYTYSDSACDPNQWWQGTYGLGTITRTFTGIPEGCSGGITIPPPTTLCCAWHPC